MPETDKELTPIVACVTVGIFQENCYLYACPQTLEAVIIDPGDEAERILEQIRELHLSPKYILNTHGHIDHTSGITVIAQVLRDGAEGDVVDAGAARRPALRRAHRAVPDVRGGPCRVRRRAPGGVSRGVSGGVSG